MPNNTDVYGVRSRSILLREAVESNARRGVSVSLDAAGHSRFPGVPDRPLQHLSVFRINNLRAVANRLSHTTMAMRIEFNAVCIQRFGADRLEASR